MSAATLVQQKLSHTSGTEGPRMDPYCYDEWKLVRQVQYGPVWEYRLHVGLSEQLSIYKNGQLVKSFEESPQESWNRLTHIPVDLLPKLFRRIDGPFDRCGACHSRKLGYSDGFAGETIQYCGNCGAILWAKDPTPYIS